MISLKRSMDQWGGLEGRFRSALGAFTRVLQALEKTASAIAGRDGDSLLNAVAQVRLNLSPDPAAEEIDASARATEEAVTKFGRRVSELREAREREIKQIVQIVVDAGVTMAKTGQKESEHLRDLARRIDTVAQLETIVEIRDQLTERVAELQFMAQRVEAESEAKARALERELKLVTEQLESAKSLAETDALTGLGNRRMVDETIKAAIDSAQRFCIIVFDLNDFKLVNDRYGHDAGDQLLKAVAASIRRVVRDDDIVCRWGGDEFLVIMRHVSLATAAERAENILTKAFGQFLLSDGAKDVTVNVKSGCGVAEHQAGESAGQLFARADEQLYINKREQKAHGSAQLQPR